jgi:hypothetical protein
LLTPSIYGAGADVVVLLSFIPFTHVR